MKVLGLQVKILVLGSGQMHECASNDLAKQDNVGQLALTNSDTK